MKFKENKFGLSVVGLCILLSSLSIARVSPIVSEINLHDKKSAQGELVTDCLERSKSLSCHRLGIYYIEKREEYTKGLNYLRSSCILGRGYSCTVLGKYYQEGMIVSKDAKKAKEWYNIGCLRESEEGCKLVESIEIKEEKSSSFFSSFFD